MRIAKKKCWRLFALGAVIKNKIQKGFLPAQGQDVDGLPVLKIMTQNYEMTVSP